MLLVQHGNNGRRRTYRHSASDFITLTHRKKWRLLNIGIQRPISTLSLTGKNGDCSTFFNVHLYVSPPPLESLLFLIFRRHPVCIELEQVSLTIHPFGSTC
ncbi:hypothetical protein HanXRQr2_Chr01g0012951 [Helianthus annuus]|uniref:Uncharacterized protein n=1 Tax=Helianthus annuus TaxID=4232 RepID=A0A251VPE3_HELAN|nr:hypothetical protein HanXRQr2_Chr01g0012951 [Helianthus annuus]KAJ0611032.1 hypothetical protein HanHA300_Chr01g0010591 [Helianthus annuus]KAJ0621940.1 hypothetical protein HanIR_Chr01g0014451 [Helianthus annuus]KAJ0626300.1 hypothetical protein HanHA89_Chr01g0011581 [Helianthus annuus]KAJ0782641.1 hypothetical protein HanLR1_Chr01g0010571 [Helianthus annuus]